MTVASDDSLKKLLDIYAAHNPLFHQLITAQTEAEFAKATEAAFDVAIKKIEAGAVDYQQLKEPGLSRLLSNLVAAAGYRSVPEASHRGHVDIVLEHALGGWHYLVECKIYDGYQYHIDACAQLLDYCSGRELRAMALEFFKAPAMFEKLALIRKSMDDERPLRQQLVSEDHSIVGAFVTTHTHEAGKPVEVVHVGCTVHVSKKKKKKGGGKGAK